MTSPFFFSSGPLVTERAHIFYMHTSLLCFVEQLSSPTFMASLTTQLSQVGSGVVRPSYLWLHSIFISTATATIYKCDAAGISILMDDVEVTIPPMAVPQGKVIHVEIGVSAYGPFTFANNCEPVSPILWFCTQEKTEFELPVTFKLPHILMNATEATLSFAKADHSFDKKNVPFKKLEAKCKFGAHHGILFSKHHCYLCIQVEANVDKLMNLSTKKGYCLHIITKKQNSLTYEIIVACTYFLTTCIKVRWKFTYCQKDITSFLTTGYKRDVPYK